jgi:hypothetical protein
LPDRHAQPFLGFLDVLDIERDQFGTPERAGKSAVFLRHKPREEPLPSRDPKLGLSDIVKVGHTADLAVFILTLDPIVATVVGNVQDLAEQIFD